MVAKIHIVALVCILAALMALVSERTYDSGRADLARRRDLISLCLFGGSFVVINLVLILQAAASG